MIKMNRFDAIHIERINENCDDGNAGHDKGISRVLE